MVRSGASLFLLTFLLFCAAASFRAQEEELVQVVPFLSKSGVHAGEEFGVALQIKIRPGWHINGPELVDEFLLPTTLSFEENKDFEISECVYPKPESGRFEYSQSVLAIYEGDVFFGALVKAAKNLRRGPQKLIGKLSFQACDARVCSSPSEVSFEVSLEVVPDSKETKDVNQDIFSKLKFKKK
jgi:DsbC/DsbD-like thiol-disulfide interchange protein